MKESTKIQHKAALLVAAGFLTGCVSSEPSSELIKATTPNPGERPIVSGAVLNECVESAGLIHSASANDVTDDVGKYSQPYTLGFAKRFESGLDIMKPYATRVRAYTVDIERTNIRGKKIYRKLICYYDIQSGGGPHFLTSLRPDTDGRVRVIDLNDAVLTAYAKMAGKNVRAVRLFGVYAG